MAAEQSTENKTGTKVLSQDAVRQSMRHLENTIMIISLILSGDQLYQMDFKEMIDFHVKNGGDITIATIPVNKRCYWFWYFEI